MKIGEALNELELDAEGNRYFHKNTLARAERLGIEALKFRLRWEQQEGEKDFPLLPGETKE